MTDKLSGIFNNLSGVLKTPSTTLGRVMETKNWLPVFMLFLAVVGILSYLSFPAQMAKMTQDPQFNELMGDEKAPYFINTSHFARTMGSLASVFTVSLSFICGAFFLYLFYGIGGTQGNFVNYFALVSHASLIDTIFPLLISTIGLFTGLHLENLDTPLLFFTNLGSKTFLYILLSVINIFSIWYIIVVASGIREYAKITLKKSLTIATLYFLFKNTIYVFAVYIMVNIIKA